MKKIIKILVLTIIVLLTMHCDKPKKNSSVFSKMIDKIDKTKRTTLDSQFNTVETAINSYYFDKNEYPEILDLLVPNYLSTENHLIDPWGAPFKLEADENMDMYIISAGRDNIFDTEDDVKRRI